MTATSIAADIERDVEQGRLSPGDPLPSIRGLAARLGVSPGTVARAYAQLRVRGLVTSQQGSRTRVSVRPALGVAFSSPPPRGVRDVASGNPDPALLPQLAPVLQRLDTSPHLYGESIVDPRLHALAADGAAADGVPAEHLAVVGGAMDGLERVLRAHLRPGDAVVVEDPGYAAVLHLARGLGLRPVAVPVDDSGAVPAALADAVRGARAVIFTPRAHNPTGAAWTATRRDELAAVLSALPEVLVIENDHAGAVAGSDYHTLVGDRERWAVLRSVSKTLGPDLRLGILVGDARTVGRVQAHQALGAGWVSHLLQRLVAELWSESESSRLLGRARESYAARRSALVDELANRGVVARGASGLNVFIPVDEESHVVAALIASGWSLRPGETYRLRARPFVRATVSLLGDDEVPELAAAIAAALRPARRTLTA